MATDGSSCPQFIDCMKKFSFAYLILGTFGVQGFLGTSTLAICHRPNHPFADLTITGVAPVNQSHRHRCIKYKSYQSSCHWLQNATSHA